MPSAEPHESSMFFWLQRVKHFTLVGATLFPIVFHGPVVLPALLINP